MALQSNIFNITKVRNGVDANSRRMTTNVETIYKFVKDTTENNAIVYNISPDIIIVGIVDTTTSQGLNIVNATRIITFDDTDLEELIGPVLFKRYYHRSQRLEDENHNIPEDDDFHWYFHIQSFYDDLYNENSVIYTSDYVCYIQVGGLTSTEYYVDPSKYYYRVGEEPNIQYINCEGQDFDENKDYYTVYDNITYLKNFFDADTPTNIEFASILESSLLYHTIPVQIGTDVNAARFFSLADGVYAAMNDAGLVFDSNGLAITNGNFSITNSNNETVFNFNKSDGILSLTGAIIATSGKFHGTIEAEDGYFNRGTIGGFNITESSIESQTQKLQLFSQVSTDPGEIEQGSIENDEDAYSNVEFKLSENLTEEEFNENKTNYYYYDNEEHEYIKCTNESIFDSNEDYYTFINDIVRTKDYIHVQSGHTYIIKTNLKKILIRGYKEEDPDSHLQSTDWVNSGYSYTPPIITTEVGGQLQQDAVNFIRILLKEQDGTIITPEDVEFLTIIEDSSLINVENIHIGDGGVLDGYLRVGNLSLINPDKNYSVGDHGSVVMELMAPDQDNNDKVYFQLTSEGYIQGNNWSIGKDTGDDVVTARFGKLITGDGVFNGTVYAKNGTFSGEITSSIISASTINTVNFITEKTRSMGGSYIFKPTFKIAQLTDRNNNIIEFELENIGNYFNFDLYEKVEDLDEATFNENKTNYYTYDSLNQQYIQCNNESIYDSEQVYYTYLESIVSVSGIDTRFGKIININKIFELVENLTEETFNNDKTHYYYYDSQEEEYVQCTDDTEFNDSQNYYVFSKELIQVFFEDDDYNIIKEDDLTKYQTLTLLGYANQDVLIGINSDNTYAGDILAPRALSMETFTSLHNINDTGDIDYNLNLLLGDLSSLSTISPDFRYVNGYGLYADNVYLHGSLTTKNNNGTFAGVHTLKDIEFNYGQWSNSPDDGTYDNEKIVFWGGSDTLDEEGIQKSPFIVTDKGSIFANRGEFKGTVITNSLISNTVIQTPVIYGSNDSSDAPSLRIYNTDSFGGTGGIGFYKKVGYIDKLTEELLHPEEDDIITLRLNDSGFIHYYSTQGQGNKQTTFISFSENGLEDGTDGIYFSGTSYTAGTTTFSSREIKDNGINPAVINLISETKNQDNTTTPGNIELRYKNYGIKITDDDNLAAVRNFGGKVINEGETIFRTSNGARQLDYKINSSGYYCLFVS